MAKNKAPTPDEVVIEYFTRFWDVIRKDFYHMGMPYKKINFQLE